MAKTLLLDRDEWDLCIDAAGNIALAAEPYSITQDVASACRLWRDELWYGPIRGIPYERILGRFQPVQLLKAQLTAAAETVPGVVRAQVFLTSARDRSVSGQVQVTTRYGVDIVTL